MTQNDLQRHIKNSRDILVGKVPDPKSQVDQITLALMYKFIDDMDQNAEEMDGQPTFFTGDYKKYSWRHLLDVKLGNQERMNLYDEALKKLPFNENLPPLFREIFKDAFLPYRDPNTLSLFLKEINYFSYDNSENLGSAFEHLLSVMSSQGDAGQFRTPRHIIDFIVAAVNPQKTDTVLDPACGTAGFLISAFKYILKTNDNKLNPDERKRISDSFAGYDISPDMVRLSLVNLYLHGFKQPKIFEYDTLGSDSKWNEFYDVILANPPFMTPRGGIKPHARFEVRANRSEVLFVDYIMEHLTPNGRAGVIVPEGIIFQSDNAYKALRKMLVENNYLYAVVSLPAGVFNPYAGVKTSVLLMDRVLARKSKGVLFVKIQNDGFGLGAQRRPIEKNDLVEALRLIKQFQKNPDQELKSDLAHVVSKAKIAESGDYNLSGDLYKETVNLVNQKWPMVELSEVFEYEQPTKYIVKSVNYNKEFKTPVLTAGQSFILGYTNEKDGIFPIKKLPVIIFDDFTTAIKFVDFPFKVKSSAMKILHVKKEKAEIKFLYSLMQRINFNSSTHKRYWISQYSKIKFPLPPLEIQKQIAEQINALEDERKFLDKEELAIIKRQAQVLENAISNKKQEVMDSKIEANFNSSFRQVESLLERIFNDSKLEHFIIESLILNLRELSYYFEKFFYDELETSEKVLLLEVTRARNAICHRSSYFNNFSDHLIIQGGLIYKNEDIEIQYGKTKISFKKIVYLYKRFRELISQDVRTNWIKKNPAWEIGQRKFIKIVNSYETKVQEIQRMIIKEARHENR